VIGLLFLRISALPLSRPFPFLFLFFPLLKIINSHRIILLLLIALSALFLSLARSFLQIFSFSFLLLLHALRSGEQTAGLRKEGKTRAVFNLFLEKESASI